MFLLAHDLEARSSGITGVVDSSPTKCTDIIFIA
jgi:hypothetical protein